MFTRNLRITVLAIASLPLLLFTASIHATVILETAPMGITNGGTSIVPTSHLSTQFLGARFTIDSPYLITQVGGHVKGYSNQDRSMFVAINRINEITGFPTDVYLSDAIYSERFVAPFNDVGPYPYQVPETILDTSFFLNPGTYSIMFGSGLFGSTGSGWMPIAATDYVAANTYFFMNEHTGSLEFHNGSFQPARFYVAGVAVPEPESLWLLLIGGLSLALTLRFSGRCRQRGAPELSR